MKENLEELRSKMQIAITAFHNAVRLEQQKCEHMSIAECEYLHMNFGQSLPPMRVCLDCGITEEGWGPGFVILQSDSVAIIKRDDLYKKRVGFYINDDHKGPLLRKEVTLVELINGDYATN